jgi:hypothetical protein
MCSTCWHRVPPFQRLAVGKTRRARLMGAAFPASSEDRDAAYRDACRDAIAAAKGALMSPLIAALIEVDTQVRALTRRAGTRPQKEALRSAMQDLREQVIDVVAARAAADGALDDGELDVDTFKAIVRHAAERGRWQDFSIAFNQVGREVRT